ncbi:PAS domain S-box protein [Methylomonas sp. LL1]|uniref:PAS domain S-box protein n=1 Tax=Methylomonas sp. LL1 TaxID=2785785 RepID=UPI0018C3E26F|nr:PAS domain S-box protein [Methylomonas sp. LL1]QPK64353.1 PAS domain S-box protein [Methylomonas sp. LL1]
MEICNIESCGEVAGRRLAEQRLSERERHYHDILHNLSDAIYLVEVTEDDRFRYLETNRAFEAMMGMAEDGMLGKCVGEVLRASGAETSAENAIAKFHRCLELGHAISGEITLDTPSGRRILNSTLTPLFDDAGRIDRILGVSRDVTASKLAERLNDFLGFALNQANDAVFLIDPKADHRFRYVNDQACRSLGYGRDELLGMSVPDIDPYVDLEAARNIDEQIRKQTSFRFETFHRRKDGQVFPVEISGTEIEHDGQTMALSIVRDITERKAAEAALRASEERMRLFFERQLVGMAITSPEKGWLKANDKICKMFGYSREELAKLTWADLTYPDDLPADVAQFERMLSGKIDSYAMEKRYLHKDGRIVFINLSVGCVRREDGAVDYVLALLEDITERKRFELDRKLLTEILEQSPDFVGTVDMQGQLGYHNLAARRMVGLADDADVTQLSISDMHPKWVTKLIMETALPIALEQGVWRGETALLHRDGREISVQQTIMLHRDADGKPKGTSTIMQDITERKHMEEQLKLKEFALEYAQDAVYLMVPNGRFAYVNDQACRALGYSRDELLKLTPFDIDPDITPESNLGLQEEVQTQGLISFETHHKRRDGSVFPVEIRGSRFDYQGQVFLLALASDISERKRMEEERLAHLHFFESMDRVNRALQGSNDLEIVLNNVLDTVLAIFDCDRAFLCHPCDPKADSWSVPFEKTKPEFPGAQALGMAMPMDADMAKTFSLLLDTDGPVTQGAGNQHPLPKEVSETFGIKSHMAVAVYPKGDKPWRFGIHQCSRTRAWTADEQKLFQEIGRHLADALTGLLVYRSLQTSEREFRTLAENMPDTLIRYDREGRRTYINPALVRISAVREEQMIGLTQQESNPFTMPEIYQLALEHTLATGERSELELPIPTPLGDIRTNLIIIAAERAADGQISGAITIGHDITERKQAEALLVQRELEFRTLAENSPDAIIRYDRDCRRTYVNRAYEIATNTQRAEIVGKIPQDDWRLAVPTADKYTKLLRRVMATGKVEQLEAQLLDADGGSHYFSMHFVPEYDEHDQVNGVLAFGADITELKTAERRRVEAREDERKLLARELHDDLGQRLTALRLDVALLELKFGKNDPELLAKIKEMDAAVGETFKIIRSLLTMLRPAILDMGLVPAMEWLVSEFRKRTQVACRLQLPEQKLALNEAQSIAIFRIVQESLTNIVKYAQASKVSIVLTREDGAYCLDIQDDGKGFDLGAAKKMGAFGLKGIEERVQVLGGKLTIETAPRHGVRLTIQLPRWG